ncbi:MAG: histidinol dehydrogenase, partial [Cyanobacteriota bacterium]|nr:histidinol dehydrogenase [Cyanobacteriota bacterium]
MTQSGQAESETPSTLIHCVRDRQQAKRELERLANRSTGNSQKQAMATVEDILDTVRSQGDQALITLTERFDGFRPEPLTVA